MYWVSGLVYCGFLLLKVVSRKTINLKLGREGKAGLFGMLVICYSSKDKLFKNICFLTCWYLFHKFQWKNKHAKTHKNHLATEVWQWVFWNLTKKAVLLYLTYLHISIPGEQFPIAFLHSGHKRLEHDKNAQKEYEVEFAYPRPHIQL